jgi:hypothetical protein
MNSAASATTLARTFASGESTPPPGDETKNSVAEFVGKTSGSDADHLAGVLSGLAPLTCVPHSKQHTPFVGVKIKPYFVRLS